MEEEALSSRLSTQEKLLLSQAVYKLGALDWIRISNLLLAHPLIADRPKEWFDPQSCEASYVGLMTEIGINVPAVDATKPQAKVHLRLAQKHYLDRLTELKSSIAEYEERFTTLMSEIQAIKAGSMDKTIKEELRGVLARKYGKKLLDSWVPDEEEIKAAAEKGPVTEEERKVLLAQVQGRGESEGEGGQKEMAERGKKDKVTVAGSEMAQVNSKDEEKEKGAATAPADGDVEMEDQPQEEALSEVVRQADEKEKEPTKRSTRRGATAQATDVAEPAEVKEDKEPKEAKSTSEVSENKGTKSARGSRRETSRRKPRDSEGATSPAPVDEEPADEAASPAVEQATAEETATKESGQKSKGVEVERLMSEDVVEQEPKAQESATEPIAVDDEEEEEEAAKPVVPKRSRRVSSSPPASDLSPAPSAGDDDDEDDAQEPQEATSKRKAATPKRKPDSKQSERKSASASAEKKQAVAAVSTRTSKRKADTQPEKAPNSKRSTRRGASPVKEPEDGEDVQDDAVLEDGNENENENEQVDEDAPAEQSEAEVEAEDPEPSPPKRGGRLARRESTRSKVKTRDSPAPSAKTKASSPAISRRAPSVSSTTSATPGDDRRSSRRSAPKGRGMGMRDEVVSKSVREQSMAADSVKEEDEDDEEEKRPTRTTRRGKAEADTPGPKEAEEKEKEVQAERRGGRRSTARNAQAAEDDAAQDIAPPSATSTPAPRQEDGKSKRSQSPAPSITTAGPGPGRRPRHSSPKEKEPRDKAAQKMLFSLLDTVSGHRNGNVFLNPVKKKDAPRYYEVIKRPMDLKTIRVKIRDGQITTVDEFERDLLLMFANATMFNQKGSAVHDMALEMMKDAEIQIREFKSLQHHIAR